MSFYAENAGNQPTPGQPPAQATDGWVKSSEQADQLVQLNQGITAFVAAAKAGKFAVNASGGQALINWYQSIQDWYAENRRSLDLAAQAPKLGGSNAAEVVSPYMAQVGQDSQGYIATMKALAERAGEAIEAIQTAMNNYKQADEDNARIVKDSDA